MVCGSSLPSAALTPSAPAKLAMAIPPPTPTAPVMTLRHEIMLLVLRVIGLLLEIGYAAAVHSGQQFSVEARPVGSLWFCSSGMSRSDIIATCCRYNSVFIPLIIYAK